MLQKCTRYMWAKQLSSITLVCPESLHPKSKENGELFPHKSLKSEKSAVKSKFGQLPRISYVEKKAQHLLLRGWRTHGNSTHQGDVVHGCVGACDCESSM